MFNFASSHHHFHCSWLIIAKSAAAKKTASHTKATASRTTKTLSNKLLALPTKSKLLVDTLSNDAKPAHKKFRVRDDKGLLKKKLYDHFKGFSDHEIYVREVDGISCWDRLERDYVLWQRGEVEMGANYYEKLRGTYRTPCTVRESLSKLPATASDTQDSELRDALLAVADRVTNIQSLLDRCEDINHVNDCNLVARVMQFVLVPRAASSGFATTLYGEEAAKAFYDSITEAFSEDPEDVVSADIAMLQCYHGVLTGDELAELRKIAISAMARAGNAAARKARRGRRAAASTDRQASMASLFQRR